MSLSATESRSLQNAGKKVTRPEIRTSSSWCHDGSHSRECETEDAGKGVVDADRPSHALLTLDRREDLGRVLERDWAFTQRIHDRK